MSSLDRAADEILTQGYTIIPNVLTDAEIEKSRTLLAKIWESEKEIGPIRGWHNKSWIISYMLPLKADFFRALALNPRILPFIQKVLGTDCILSSLNGMTMTPNGQQQRLHLDQPAHTPGLVININALYTLDDFTKANGCTRVVPGTQNRAPGTPINHEEDETNAIYLEAPVGSLIAFNGGLVHAGSANTTPNVRRCMHAYYTRSWCRPQWDFVRSFPEQIKSALSAEQKQIFGFNTHEQVYDLSTHETRRA